MAREIHTTPAMVEVLKVFREQAMSKTPEEGAAYKRRMMAMVEKLSPDEQGGVWVIAEVALALATQDGLDRGVAFLDRWLGE